MALERAFLFPALEGWRVCGNELVCWELRRVFLGSRPQGRGAKKPGLGQTEGSDRVSLSPGAIHRPAGCRQERGAGPLHPGEVHGAVPARLLHHHPPPPAAAGREASGDAHLRAGSRHPCVCRWVPGPGVPGSPSSGPRTLALPASSHTLPHSSLPVWGRDGGRTRPAEALASLPFCWASGLGGGWWPRRALALTPPSPPCRCPGAPAGAGAAPL